MAYDRKTREVLVTLKVRVDNSESDMHAMISARVGVFNTRPRNAEIQDIRMLAEALGEDAATCFAPRRGVALDVEYIREWVLSALRVLALGVSGMV